MPAFIERRFRERFASWALNRASDFTQSFDTQSIFGRQHKSEDSPNAHGGTSDLIFTVLMTARTQSNFHNSTQVQFQRSLRGGGCVAVTRTA